MRERIEDMEALAAENERLREHDEAVRKAVAKLAVALDVSVRDELAQRGHLRELTAENARLRKIAIAAKLALIERPHGGQSLDAALDHLAEAVNAERGEK